MKVDSLSDASKYLRFEPYVRGRCLKILRLETLNGSGPPPVGLKSKNNCTLPLDDSQNFKTAAKTRMKQKKKEHIDYVKSLSSLDLAAYSAGFIRTLDGRPDVAAYQKHLDLQTMLAKL